MSGFLLKEEKPPKTRRPREALSVLKGPLTSNLSRRRHPQLTSPSGFSAVLSGMSGR